MVDGVLIVSVPKVEKKFQKKEVRIENSPPAEDTHMDEEDVSAAADAAYMEMGRDHTMWSADTTQNSTKDSSSKETPKEAEHQTARDDRSETLASTIPTPRLTRYLRTNRKRVTRRRITTMASRGKRRVVFPHMRRK
ncbi:hypothetical protein CLAIMM_15228 [Cladophialophora immunda]|nr:hypothetical protein CLAIMM_15228 [Cladophialophora immunda]